MKEETEGVVNIKEKFKIECHNAKAIAGFAEAGMVGTITVNYIVEELKMREVAYFSSRLIPSYTIFLDGLLKYPLRIYINDEGNLVAIVSEVPLPSTSYFDISYSLLEWLESKKIREITVLAGVSMDVMPVEKIVYAAAEPEILDKLRNIGLKMLSRGIISGISASILNQCLHRDITGICLLAPIVKDSPNPEAAISLVETLNKIYGINVNLDKLVKEAQDIQLKRKEVTEAMKKVMKSDVTKRLYL
ncbi:MAG: proteasome assembly chaperone family protein [Candidatus Odinarchaeia archaeon]